MTVKELNEIFTQSPLCSSSQWTCCSIDEKFWALNSFCLLVLASNYSPLRKRSYWTDFIDLSSRQHFISQFGPVDRNTFTKCFFPFVWYMTVQNVGGNVSELPDLGIIRNLHFGLSKEKWQCIWIWICTDKTICKYYIWFKIRDK